MRFFLKVLVLVGLIAVGKWEKITTISASKQTSNTSYPVYSQNVENRLPTQATSEQLNLRKIPVNLNY
jgi:hypothetical protein